MASIYRDITVEVNAERAWQALRDVESTACLFAGVLRAARVDGDVRTVTFETGLTLRERIIGWDEERRRIAYTVLDGRFEHHNASMQIVPRTPNSCRFVWISDVLPDCVSVNIVPFIDAGCAALKRNLEGSAWSAARALSHP